MQTNMFKAILSLALIAVTLLTASAPAFAQDTDPRFEEIQKKYQHDLDDLTRQAQDLGKEMEDEVPNIPIVNGRIETDMVPLSISFDLPEVVMRNKEISFDVPQVTHELKTMSFKLPKTSMKPHIVGHKPEITVRGLKVYTKWTEIITDLPVVTMVLHEIKTKIPKVTVGRMRIVVKLPEVTMKTREFSWGMPSVRVSDAKQEIGKLESEMKYVSDKLNATTDAMKAEIDSATRDILAEQRSKLVAEFDSARAELLSQRNGQPVEAHPLFDKALADFDTSRDEALADLEDRKSVV